MVAVEFSIDASDETIAAAKAASTRPFNPTGMNDLISHGEALSLTIFPFGPKNVGSATRK